MKIGPSRYFFLDICSLERDWWDVIIGLYNGLKPNRRQAITLTNGDTFQRRIYPALGGDEYWGLNI